MAADSAAPPAAAPSAHSILAADGTASYGFMMFGGPVWPKPSMRQAAHVDGSNCIGPSAPAGDGPVRAHDLADRGQQPPGQAGTVRRRRVLEPVQVRGRQLV